MIAILTAQEIDKAFGTRHVLRGVSLAVHEGDRVGLVGVNGSGKSTLLRLLVGDGASAGAGASVAPDSAGLDAGLITRKRGLRLAFVPQEPVLDPMLTVRETLRAGLPGRSWAGDEAGAAVESQDYEIRGLAAAFRLPALESAVGALSVGERRRVALARALLGRPELLALDEPTNHLDARSVEWLEARLLERGGSLLLVTHDRYFLDQVATRILELDRGRLYTYEGGYGRFLELQAARLENEASHERERASFVRRELDWIRRGPCARATKQRARIERFDSAVAARPEERAPSSMSLRLPTGGRLGKTILELRGLGRTLGGRRLFGGLDLVWKPGDRIGVVGPNGAGKTTLVRTVLGLEAPDTGEVVVGQNTRFAYLDQSRDDLRDDRTVLAEVSGDSEHVFLEEGPVHVRTFLRRMLFDDAFADTPVGALSGGERNRVRLAKLLRAAGNFIVLDEPTNDLDLLTLGVLEEALAVFPGCALVVSHDRYFLDRVATGILALDGEGRIDFHEGNYSSYLERLHLARPAAPPASTEAAERPAAPRRGRPSPRRLSYNEQRELEGIEEAIGAAEARVAALEATLSDPAVYRERGAEVRAIVAALEDGRREVGRLYDRWEELETIRG
jgi:ABC transport system ATP-binding/permease protein